VTQLIDSNDVTAFCLYTAFFPGFLWSFNRNESEIEDTRKTKCE